jgi:hypothetical protein
MSASIGEQPRQAMQFIGVTTGKSSIMKVFPRWVAELGRPEVELEGIDLPLHAAPEAYRQVVARIQREDHLLGALVTSHKINLLDAARDMFDYLDPYARIWQPSRPSCARRRCRRGLTDALARRDIGMYAMDFSTTMCRPAREEFRRPGLPHVLPGAEGPPAMSRPSASRPL